MQPITREEIDELVTETLENMAEMEGEEKHIAPEEEIRALCEHLSSMSEAVSGVMSPNKSDGGSISPPVYLHQDKEQGREEGGRRRRAKKYEDDEDKDEARSREAGASPRVIMVQPKKKKKKKTSQRDGERGGERGGERASSQRPRSRGSSSSSSHSRKEEERGEETSMFGWKVSSSKKATSRRNKRNKR